MAIIKKAKALTILKTGVISLFLLALIALIISMSVVPWLPVVKREYSKGIIKQIVILAPHSRKYIPKIRRNLVIELNEKRRSVTIKTGINTEYKVGDIITLEKNTRKFGFVFYRLGNPPDS